MAKAKETDDTPPKVTAKARTGRQKPQAGIGDIVGQQIVVPGYTSAPKGSYKIWRSMRGNPTVAIARLAAYAPILAANISIESEDDAPDEWVEFIKKVKAAVWSKLLRQILYALDYGWVGFEKIFGVRDMGNLGQRIMLDRMKMLMPDITDILTDPDTGDFMGLRNTGVTLGPNECLLFTHDDESGDFRGRPRHENIRQVWWDWMQAAAKEGQYITKAAGVLMLMQYPEGISRDRSGSEVDNFDLAERTLKEIGKGHGVCMPNTLSKHAYDLMRAGVDIAQLKAWHFDMVETGAGHGSEFVAIMQHKEALMCRGWLVPERAATEGQYGTKAEAGVHTQLSLIMAEQLLEQIIESVNQNVVDPLIAYNYGGDPGSVKLRAESLTSERRAFAQNIMTAVLTNPANLALLGKLVDIDAMMDSTGLPKAEEVLDIDLGELKPPEPGPKPEPVAGEIPAEVAASVYERLGDLCFSGFADE